MEPNEEPLGIDVEGAGEQGEAAAENAAATPESELDTLRRERDDIYDRLLRKTAEFDNYRKRVDKERRDQAEWAAADVIGDVLNAVDDFERALAAEAPPEAEAYRAGVELIHRQLSEVLRRRGVTTFDSLGVDFDPHLHQ